MRTGDKRINYEEISRKSIYNELHPVNKRPIVKVIHPVKEIKIKQVNPSCEYAKFARLIIGRAVELVERKGSTPESKTGWYRFKNDIDRKALNREAGWSDNKNIYYFHNPILL